MAQTHGRLCTTSYRAIKSFNSAFGRPRRLATGPSEPPAAASTSAREPDNRTITLYDLRCRRRNQCWSDACWRARLTLQYKKLPFKTIWVSYPDVQSTVGHLQRDADPVTLPVLRHGDNWISGSYDIAWYLESHFPDSPPLMIPNVDYIQFFQSYVSSILMPAIEPLVISKIPKILDVRGREYFIRTEEERRGSKLEDIGKGMYASHLSPQMAPIADTLLGHSNRYGYLTGIHMSYIDIILLAMIKWLDRIDHDAVLRVLRMHQSGDRKPLRDWYGQVRHLAVEQDEKKPPRAEREKPVRRQSLPSSAA